jgi:C1A family cysteine protease
LREVDKIKRKSFSLFVFMLLIVSFFTMSTQSSEQERTDKDENCPCRFGTILEYYPLATDEETYNKILENVPPVWDWRDVEGRDWTTPIKDQLQDVCGSCWAFGALAGLESYIEIWSDNPDLNPDLSEQFMLSCSPGGCNGWYWTLTLKWIKENGAIPESCLPYEADDEVPCENKCPEWKNLLVGIDNYHKLSPTVSVIQSALVEYGPLPCTMKVYEDFYPNWSGGVYEYSWGNLVFGHCITIVGYNDTWGSEDEGYWICKNSWGTEWGEDGWFRIAYHECEIENGVYYYTGPNYPADKPETPSGKKRGKVGEKYTFSASTIDPDGDMIKYCFDWGEGNQSWSDFVDSGKPVSLSYTWETEGNYEIKVKVQDEHGLESDWSDPLKINIPRSRQSNINKLAWLFERFPNAFPIFRQLLGLI